MIFDLNVVSLSGREREKKGKRPLCRKKRKRYREESEKTFLLRRENSLVEQILIIEVSFLGKKCVCRGGEISFLYLMLVSVTDLSLGRDIKN